MDDEIPTLMRDDEGDGIPTVCSCPTLNGPRRQGKAAGNDMWNIRMHLDIPHIISDVGTMWAPCIWGFALGDIRN